MDDKQYSKDLKAMIAADRGHMREAASRGNGRDAREFLTEIQANTAILRDLNR